jgi:glyoxylase-like metal-dependent hydrolase (beta-lactamase superfamily II)
MFAHRIAIPTPFPVGPVNAYLLGPSPVTLVDCGPRTDEAWEALRAGLQLAGRRVEQVERLVLTHPHHDHAGLARRVRGASGCRVYAHPADRPRLLGRPGEWDRISGFLVEACRRAGVPVEALRVLEEQFSGVQVYAEPLDEVLTLAEGETLPVGSRALSVLYTPGHARGAVCLWEPSGRVLLSGDTLLPHISSNAILEPGLDAFRDKTLLRYQETLGRLSNLRPAAVLPGHGDPMGGVQDLIRRRLALYENRAARIRTLVGEGLSSPWQVAERLFPGISASQAFLAVSEVVGHLDLLAAQGEVAFEGQEGPWVAHPAAPRDG